VIQSPWAVRGTGMLVALLIVAATLGLALRPGSSGRTGGHGVAQPRPIVDIATAPAPAADVSTTPSPTATASPTTIPAGRPAPPPATPPGTLTGAGVHTVAIPSQGVVAPIDMCTIDHGELEPPADVHRTCRWAGGSDVDSPTGTTVLTGHVNFVGQGTGALGRLAQLRVGALVVTRERTTTRWRVVGVTRRDKTTGIDRSAFVGTAGARQLYLISCGGTFDASARSYEDNIYVRAVPITS
jgi:hypothetical protein